MCIKKVLLSIVAFIILLSPISISQSKSEKINNLINRYLEYRLFNGSALVAENGEVVPGQAIHSLLSKITVRDVMTRQVLTVTEDTAIEQAARIMVDNKIGGVPVMRDAST